MHTFCQTRLLPLLALTLSTLSFLNHTVAEDIRTSAQTRIVLAGDSTVTDDAGWGKGFAEFLNDLGSDRIKGNHEHARWVSLSGQNDGQPVTITVLCHRDNFRAPQAARLHPTKPYFVFCSWQTRFPPTRGRWGTTDDIDSRKSWGCGRSLRHEN